MYFTNTTLCDILYFMKLMERLEGAGAVVQGKHFVYTRGQHGPDYVRIDALLSKENQELLFELCGEMAAPFKNDDIEAVTACAEDRCNRLADYIAEHLGVKATSGKLLHGRKTLIGEDVLTTGEGVVKIRRAAESHGAYIVGASVIVNRGRITKEQLGVPRLEVLANVPLLAYEPNECGLCTERIPIVVDEGIGSGSAYKLDHPNYAGGYQKLLSEQLPDFAQVVI